jgi:hypothetical protein
MPLTRRLSTSRVWNCLVKGSTMKHRHWEGWKGGRLEDAPHHGRGMGHVLRKVREGRLTNQASCQGALWSSLAGGQFIL